MKGIHMKAPALTQIYTQKTLHQAHLRKLTQIRQQRKSQMGLNNSQRLVYHQQLKDTKSRSFAYKFNQQNTQISKQNLKLLVRLQRTKPYFRYTSHDNRQNLNRSRQSTTYVTPYVKKQLEQTQKQNLRLSNRVSTISSSLNQKNLLRDFVKSQRIKSRITRYAIDNQNKVTLKSQKYVNLSQSKFSNSSEKAISHKPKAKSNLGNYYNKEDIIKNKIENVGKSLMKLKNNRVNVSATFDQNNQENKQTFFSTQPMKNATERRFVKHK